MDKFWRSKEFWGVAVSAVAIFAMALIKQFIAVEYQEIVALGVNTVASIAAAGFGFSYTIKVLEAKNEARADHIEEMVQAQMRRVEQALSERK